MSPRRRAERAGRAAGAGRTGLAVRLGIAQLRAAARVLDWVGLRVEFESGAPSSPVRLARSGKHVGAVRTLRLGLSPRLPVGRVAVENVAVAAPPGSADDAADACRVVDLAVCPTAFLRSDDRFLHPQDVETLVEIVTPDATGEQVAQAVDWYARAGVRSLLVVDPRAAPGHWSHYAEPVAGHYWLTRHGAYGEPLRLHGLGIDLATAHLPVYEPQR